MYVSENIGFTFLTNVDYRFNAISVLSEYLQQFLDSSCSEVVAAVFRFCIVYDVMPNHNFECTR